MTRLRLSRKGVLVAVLLTGSACQILGGIDDREVYRGQAGAGAGGDASPGGTAGSTAGGTSGGGTSGGGTSGVGGASGSGGTPQGGAGGAGGTSGGGGTTTGGAGGSGGASGSGGTSQGGTGGAGGTPGCVKELRSGSLHSCAIRSDGATFCWGRNDAAQVLGTAGGNVLSPVLLASLPTATTVGMGNHTTCVVPLTGSPLCFGLSDLGQLAQQTSFVSPPKVMTQLGPNVSRIAGGYGFGCASVAGALQCWGDNQWGQLGQGSTGGTDCQGKCSFSPLSVPLGTQVVNAFATGWDHACAVQDGGLRCWGSNQQGQIGSGSTSATQASPFATFPSSAGVVGVTAGSHHTCASKDDGSVWCWGRNAEGQLGTGAASTPIATPTKVPALASGVTAVSSGAKHACAILSGGVLWCWGSNPCGQLGRGAQSSFEATPAVATAVPTGVVEAALGEDHTCVRLADSTLRCFGCGAAAGIATGAQLTPLAPLVPCP